MTLASHPTPGTPLATAAPKAGLRILHVTPAFYPATYWGGPIFSTKMICDEVTRQAGIEVAVLTTDSAGPRASDRVAPEGVRFPYPVTYTRRIAGHSIAPGLLWRLVPAMLRCDVVHVTATYSFPVLPTLALARLLGKPAVWSPRGGIQATEDWAGAPRRTLKRTFHRLARLCCGPRTVVHVTAEAERVSCARALSGVRTIAIPNGVALPPTPTAPPRPVGAGLRLMFLGRLHPKKGLDRLFDAMDRLPQNLVLDVYGDGAADYAAQLRQRAGRSGGRIRLHGPVAGAAKTAAFANADLFVLPTFSENFGIAVAEALAHSVPVLTTTATPWGELQTKGCGACIDPQKGDIATAVADLAQRDLRRMGEAGRIWMEAEFSAPAVGRMFRDLYLSLASPQVRTAEAS